MIPFEGMIIHSQTPEIEKDLTDLDKAFRDNIISPTELKQRIDTLLKQDKIQIEKNIADPYAKGVIKNAKKKARGQQNHRNPLTGKGKSYGNHVESGWGKYVKPTGDPDHLDDLHDLDDLWNDGRW